jgi:hypothetical protein
MSQYIESSEITHIDAPKDTVIDIVGDSKEERGKV